MIMKSLFEIQKIKQLWLKIDYNLFIRVKLMSDKYYHNDIKKKLGIDQTRTASQKLLDQVNLSKRLFKKQQNIQKDATSKKFKSNDEKADCVSIKEKLLKNIRSPISLVKLTKAINILVKCLNDQQFIKQNYSSLQQWFDLARLIGALTVYQGKLPAGTLLQMRGLMQAIDQVLLQIKTKLGSFKSQTFNVTQKEQNNQANEHNEKCIVTQLVVVLQLQCYLCRLYTDDSFQFIMWFSKLKQLMFKQFEKMKEKTEQDNQRERQQVDNKLQNWSFKSQLIKCLFKIFKVPITTQIQSTRTSISTMLKQIIYNYKSSLFLGQQEAQKQFLARYNQFLSKKEKNIQTEKSYSIMGNGGVSRQDRSLETGGGADTWISKQ